MKIITIVFLLAGYIQPFLAFSQNDNWLFYTRNNRPSEANFKYKNYNDLAFQYNQESKEIRKERGMSFLKSLGAIAGATLIHLLVEKNVKEDEDPFSLHFIAYGLDGVAIGVVVNEIRDRKGEANYAISIYEMAQQELKRINSRGK